MCPKQTEGGRKITDDDRELGVTEQTYHRCKRQYVGMGVTELQELRKLREEKTVCPSWSQT